MTLLVRALDGLAAALLACLVAVLLTGGFSVPVGPRHISVTRPEDVLLATLAVLALRWWLAPVRLPTVRPGRAVAAGVALYALVFSFISVTQHYTLRTHALDLGYYVQELWLMARGLSPFVSIWGLHAFAGHLDPSMYLLVPIAWVAPIAPALLIAQSVALALGAVPLYLLARVRLGEGPAAGLAVLYLLNPSLHGINTKDFHTAALAIPLLLTAMYAVEARRPWLFLAATIATLGLREDAAIPVVGLGLWLALARRRWVWGAAVAAGGVAWLLAAVHWVMPHFSGVPYPYFAHRYTHLGRSLGEIFLAPVLRPGAIIALVASARRLTYLFAMLAPLGFLPLLAPLASVGALPALAQNLLNTDPVLFNYRTQYQSFVLPFLLVGAVAGLDALPRVGRTLRTPALVTAAALVSLALTSRTLNDLGVSRWWPGERERAAFRVLAQVPPEATVAAWERFVPHLAERRGAFVFPLGIDRSDYLALEVGALVPGARQEIPAVREGDTVTFEAGQPAGPLRFTVVAEEDRFVLLRRIRD